MECFHPLGTFSPLCRERRMADTEEKNMRAGLTRIKTCEDIRQFLDSVNTYDF